MFRTQAGHKDWGAALPCQTLAWVACAALFPMPSNGQGAELEPIVVTATRLPTPLSEVASSVTVITAEQIERKQFRTVSEALTTVPGLSVVQLGSAGQQTSVFMRGANSNQTLVLIDGMVANDPTSPSGAFDFSNLVIDNIERIEVVRGPQSTLYGSAAIGGVINIVTRRGAGPSTASGFVEAGSDDTFNQSASIQGASGPLDYSAGLIHIRSDGDSVTPARLRNGLPREDDGFENRTASARVGFSPNAHLDLNFLGRYLDGRTETDPGVGEDPDARLDQTQYYLRGEAKAALYDGLWDSSLAFSYNDYDRHNRNDRQDPGDTFERSTFKGNRLQLEWTNDLYLLENHIVTVGFEIDRKKANSDSQVDSGGFPLVASTDADVRTGAAYLQDQFSFEGRLFGTVGVRLDDHETFGREFTFRIAPVYLHRRTGTRFAASVGTGFKAPSLDQLYGVTASSFGVFRGNPDLDAERSTGWEVGLEQPLLGERVEVGATYFRSRIEDLIAFVALPSGDSTLENLDKANIHGVEAFLSAQPTTSASLRVDYTYTDADDDQGNPLLRRPRHKVGLDLDFRPAPKANVSLGIDYLGRWKDIGRVSFSEVNAGNYTLVNLAASYSIGERLELFGRVDNLLDKTYEPADGFAGPDRALIVGLRGKL